MNFRIKTIPHSEQSYPTVGDYSFDPADPTTLEVRVSDTGNEDYNFAVAIHELIEAYLYLKKGDKPLEDIDEFDKKFEEMRAAFPDLVGSDEPGDNVKAPYYPQHQMATQFERNLVAMMGLDWQEYEQAVNAL